MYTRHTAGFHDVIGHYTKGRRLRKNPAQSILHIVVHNLKATSGDRCSPIIVINVNAVVRRSMNDVTSDHQIIAKAGLNSDTVAVRHGAVRDYYVTGTLKIASLDLDTVVRSFIGRNAFNNDVVTVFAEVHRSCMIVFAQHNQPTVGSGSKLSLAGAVAIDRKVSQGDAICRILHRADKPQIGASPQLAISQLQHRTTV
ncbi:hypothetical protein D9M73_112370 [compost metagenome]